MSEWHAWQIRYMKKNLPKHPINDQAWWMKHTSGKTYDQLVDMAMMLGWRSSLPWVERG